MSQVLKNSSTGFLNSEKILFKETIQKVNECKKGILTKEIIITILVTNPKQNNY